MSDDDNTFRVWIGCLACYNGGDLVGAHWDAIEAGEVTSTDVHTRAGVKGRAEGDTFYVPGDPNPHEEIWCFDIENAPKGHHNEMSPMEAQRLADVLEAVGEDNAEAFAAYCANTGADFNEDSVSDFEEHFLGHHASFRDYADELADDTFDQLGITYESGDSEMPFARRYFDWDAHARELLIGGYWTEDAADGGVYIFSS